MQLANGNVNVQRSVLPEDPLQATDATVAEMMRLAEGQYGMRSPRIRALAINIVRQAKVREKDYYGETKAIHEWVKRNIRYMRDPVNQETLSHPEELAFNTRAGDCLHEDTLLLTPAGLVPIRDIMVGDTVYGKDGWTTVLNHWDKGVLPVSVYGLDNGGEFLATDEHRCFLADGREVNASDLKLGDTLLQPVQIESGRLNTWSLDDCYFLGLYLADGWQDGNRICIAGKDGFPKEQQKHWVAQYAAAKGLKTSWHPRYIRVYSDDWVSFVGKATAIDKKIDWSLLTALDAAQCQSLLNGLLADGHQPADRRSGKCFSTISHEMALQVRFLYRRLGKSCRITKVEDHGGLGTHAIYRVYPRLYRPKAATLDFTERIGAVHVYDIETEDHGIYLPESDVIVHNCDDMTILEIALLGSIGIKAWPVVIGMREGVPSHVYLQAKIPPGKHRNAGKVINLDPIMKEWKAGKEAPAHRVKIRHDYNDGDYANGIQRQRKGVSMSGASDLGDAYAMLPGMGAYATAPSYLDTEDSQAQKLLRPDLSVTTGSVANTAKVGVEMEGLDGMFSGMGDVVDVGVNTPMQDRDSLQQLGPKGPLTAFSARTDTHLIPSVQPRPISGKKYEQTGMATALAASRGGTPAQVGKKKHVVTVRTDEGMIAKAPKTAQEEANEIRGLAAVITELQNDFLPGIGALGEEEKKEVAERGAIAAWWATFKARAAAARAAWQAERARQARMQRFDAAAQQAQVEAAQERLNAKDAEQLAKAAGAISYQMARQDPEVAQSVAQAFVAMESQEADGQQVDGLLGLSADDLRAGKANMRRGRRQSVTGGRRSAAMVVESNDDSPLTLEERAQIQKVNQGRIVAAKMQQLAQTAKKGRRLGQGRRSPVMAPINVTSVSDPARAGQRRGVMEWLSRVFGNDRASAPVMVEQQRPTMRARRRMTGNAASDQTKFPLNEASVSAQELMPQATPAGDSIAGLGITNHLTNPLVLGAAGLGLWWLLSRKK